MPWPPVDVTPGALSTNPWIDANDKPRSLVEAEVEPSKTISIKASDPWYHSRSQTTTGDPLWSSSVSSNEFQDVSGQRSASLDLHETRPSLKRAISRNRKTFEGERPVDINGGKETTEAEAEVIVHQIQPGDSLPGVALKYNVSLATLRSANKLWANDPIHLRQVLYIPIQAIATGKAKSIPKSTEARPEYPPHSLHSAPEVHTQTFPRMHRSSLDWTTNSDPETTVLHASAIRAISSGSTSVIKRIPLSELSFFPPSSTSALSSSKHASLHTQPQSSLSLPNSDNAGTVSPSFPGHSTRVSPAFGLANLWNGAKDEIVSRLSFDSTRGSSDASEEHDLELDVVRPRGRVRDRNGSMDSAREQELIPQSDGTAIAMHSITEHDNVILNTPRRPKVVRTIQLQPSPKMVIPPISVELHQTSEPFACLPGTKRTL